MKKIIFSGLEVRSGMKKYSWFLQVAVFLMIRERLKKVAPCFIIERYDLMLVHLLKMLVILTGIPITAPCKTMFNK